MTPKELDARSCLANGGYLIDPRYATDKIRAEAALKQRVKECWQFREGFPPFVKDYVAKWSGEANAKAVRAERETNEVPDLETVGRDDARSS